MIEPVIENGGNTDAEIIEGASVTVTLGGKQFTFEEIRGRRARRALVRKIAAIEDLINKTPDFELDEDGNAVFDPTTGQPIVLKEGDINAQWEFYDKALDLFFEVHSDMRKDKTFLNENAEENEISVAFNAFRSMVMLPFMKKRAEIMRKAEEAAVVAETILTP